MDMGLLPHRSVRVDTCVRVVDQPTAGFRIAVEQGRDDVDTGFEDIAEQHRQARVRRQLVERVEEPEPDGLIRLPLGGPSTAQSLVGGMHRVHIQQTRQPVRL